MKTIVLYNVDKETIKKYQEIKELEDIQFKQIFDEDLQVTIEDLFDLPEHDGTCKKYSKSYMLFSGIDADGLSAFTQILKENNLSFKGVKVMKTSHNIKWTLNALLDEVTEEDAIMTRVTILKKLLIASNEVDLNAYTEEKTYPLKQALMKGYLLLQNKELELIKIDESINSIKYFLNDLKV